MAKLSDFVLLGAIGLGGYLIYKSGIWRGLQGIGGAIGTITQIPGYIVGGVTQPLVLPGGVSSPSIVELWKAGTGQQGYVYDYQRGKIITIPKEQEFPTGYKKIITTGVGAKDPVVGVEATALRQKRAKESRLRREREQRPAHVIRKKLFGYQFKKTPPERVVTKLPTARERVLFLRGLQGR